MNSTVRASFTGFVPESIISGVFAGQDSGDRYRSRLEMKCSTGNADQRIRPRNAADLRVDVPLDRTGSPYVPAWSVPSFYRKKITNALAVAGLFLPIFVAVLLADRDARKAGRWRKAGAR